jgi:hypothetical protein
VEWESGRNGRVVCLLFISGVAHKGRRGLRVVFGLWWWLVVMGVWVGLVMFVLLLDVRIEGWLVVVTGTTAGPRGQLSNNP